MQPLHQGMWTLSFTFIQKETPTFPEALVEAEPISPDLTGRRDPHTSDHGGAARDNALYLGRACMPVLMASPISPEVGIDSFYEQTVDAAMVCQSQA